MRMTTQTSPTLRVRREVLRELTSEDLRLVAGGSTGCKTLCR